MLRKTTAKDFDHKDIVAVDYTRWAMWFPAGKTWGIIFHNSESSDLRGMAEVYWDSNYRKQFDFIPPETAFLVDRPETLETTSRLIIYATNPSVDELGIRYMTKDGTFTSKATIVSSKEAVSMNKECDEILEAWNPDNLLKRELSEYGFGGLFITAARTRMSSVNIDWQQIWTLWKNKNEPGKIRWQAGRVLEKPNLMNIISGSVKFRNRAARNEDFQWQRKILRQTGETLEAAYYPKKTRDVLGF
jgi:hypothetical protein